MFPKKSNNNQKIYLINVHNGSCIKRNKISSRS